MSDYLATMLAQSHRDDLLAEAHADGLARRARAGRPSWTQRLGEAITRLGSRVQSRHRRLVHISHR